MTRPVTGSVDLEALRHELVLERQRLERLLQQLEEALRPAAPPSRRAVRGPAVRNISEGPTAPQDVPRSSPLDRFQGVLTATADLRVAGGNLSAERIAKLFGVSLSRLAGWLGRSRQALTKTPDAEALQPALAYFERVARLRLVARSDVEFRKWLRMPNDTLGGRTPLDCLGTGQWQALADKVDDMLTGAPS